MGAIGAGITGATSGAFREGPDVVGFTSGTGAATVGAVDVAAGTATAEDAAGGTTAVSVGGRRRVRLGLISKVCGKVTGAIGATGEIEAAVAAGFAGAMPVGGAAAGRVATAMGCACCFFTSTMRLCSHRACF